MKLYGGQPREQFIWTADKQQCSATVLCKVAAALSILFNLCLQFPELSLCQHRCTFDRWSPACEAGSLSLVETLHLTVFFFVFFSLLPHRYAAQWVAVAVAPIMNSLLHLNTEYFHYISFIGIMRAGGKLTAGLCNSMASTALFSTGLCLGACLSVWSSCVGLDTGVQVKWLLALMESPHLPDVYISFAYCYSRPSCTEQPHQGMRRHFQEQYLRDYRAYHYCDNADLKNLCMQTV